MKVIRVDKTKLKYLYRVLVNNKPPNLKQIEINGITYEISNEFYSMLDHSMVVVDSTCSLDSWTKPRTSPVLRSVKFKNTIYQF
jgi:hypothetical protein